MPVTINDIPQSPVAMLEQRAPWWVTAIVWFGMPAVLAAYLLLVQGAGLAALQSQIQKHIDTDHVVVALMAQTCLNTSNDPSDRAGCIAALLGQAPTANIASAVAEPLPLPRARNGNKRHNAD